MVYCQEVKILRVLLTRSSAVSSMLKLLFRKTVRQPPSHASRGSNEGYDITKHGVKLSHNLVPRALSLLIMSDKNEVGLQRA